MITSAEFAAPPDGAVTSSEARLSSGLAAVIRVTDQLLICPDEDSLVRRAVELAREQLGVERFSIFLDVPSSGEMVGTYGTNMNGQTTCEAAVRIPMGDIPTTPPPLEAQSTMRWIYHDKESLESSQPNIWPVSREWMVATPIYSSAGRLGVAFQDAAITQSPVDAVLLDIVTIYCSMLGSMIESKRAAEAARLSQRQTSEGLGVVLDMADELVLCEDLDSLTRHAVEMVRERLGIERLGIFLLDSQANLLRGTYGIDHEGHLRDERGNTAGISALEMPTPASKNALSRLKIYQTVSADDDVLSAEAERRHRDWVVSTPIQSSQGVIGICFNDNALTRHPMNESQQETLAVFCSILGNMIENKRATQAMRESQRSIAMLMSNLPGMAYRCRNDAAWTMEFVSEGALELTGYAPESLIDSRDIEFSHLIHPVDRTSMSRGFEVALGTGSSSGTGTRFQLSYRITTAGGEQKWVFEQGSGIFSSSGELVALEGFISDVTARKQAEEELRQAKAGLEARVDARTAELARANELLRLENRERQSALSALHEVAEALRLSKEEAERANGAKSEFLSRMSHELRTPLNAILGFGQVLEMADLPPRRQESVNHILRAGRHLLDLINEVLDISRVESGHLELSLEPVALGEVIGQCCALVRPLAAGRGIDLHIETGGANRGWVLADSQRLKQVLLNLLANAIKYNCEAGKVFISCETPVSGRVSIAVRDTGPGLSPAEIAKLFHPFERLSAANTGVEGTGLGLVLAQRLAEAMGGNLVAQSTPGEGSTFRLDLPDSLLPDSLGENPMVAPGAECAPALTAAVALPTKQVLVVEDNLSNLRLIEILLEERSHVQLLAAMQGSVGLDLARQHHPDLILLDLNLPDMSGREVLARLQESASTADIPVVIISADATSQQIERLLDAGAKRYLTKPLDLKQFLRMLDEMLNDGAEELASEMQSN